jgi:hypothetical protein
MDKNQDIDHNKEYIFNTLPRKSPVLQLLLRNTTFMTTPLGKYLIKIYAPGLREFSYIPGFIMLYGNISGSQVGLCDVFCADYAPIFLGHNVGFSFRNMLLTSWHDEVDFSTIRARPIVIHDNVWITSNCTILGGVEIGENTIIAAGSVVTKSIPPNVIAGGNPCRPIRARRSPDDADR